MSQRYPFPLNNKLIASVSIVLCFSALSFAQDLVKPDTRLDSKTVVTLQLDALARNDSPYKNAGIAQTYELAHPDNKATTGPLTKFTLMLHAPAYRNLLNHRSHEISLYKETENVAVYAVTVIDSAGTKVGYQWILSKVTDGELTGCWMTSQVSPAVTLGQQI
ncbi:MAG: hypothetical protein DHS20C01_05680 [marine bacterium B5-7]|nr:MAG: hypothetical protein DHS20C01_05680 [marine bacterium B5-7]